MKFFRLVLPVMVVFSLLLTGCNSSVPTNNMDPISTVNPTDSQSSKPTPNLAPSVSPSCSEIESTFGPNIKKPVIYLYPVKQQKVDVTLDFKGKLTCTYPEYHNGWKVIANPNGTLINIEDKREYSYLYWEGETKTTWDLSEGFVIRGNETERFLKEKLEYLGLTPKEYNEFIVYWLPQMKNNNFNLIKFALKEYEDISKLNVSPKPDSVLRIFMVYQALENSIPVKEQKLKHFERKGFAVIEWGGSEINLK